MPDKFLICVIISYPWDAKKFAPKFTEIPPHVILVSEMEGMRHKFDSLRANIKGDMEEIIDERGVMYHNTTPARCWRIYKSSNNGWRLW